MPLNDRFVLSFWAYAEFGETELKLDFTSNMYSLALYYHRLTWYNSLLWRWLLHKWLNVSHCQHQSHSGPRSPGRSYSTNLSLQLIKRNKQINKQTNQSGLFTRVGKYCVREFMWSHVSLVVRCFGRTKTVQRKRKNSKDIITE